MKVAIYARVSTGRQEREETIETQLDVVRTYCERNDLEIATVFKDEGVSGTVPFDERPGGSALLDAARTKTFERVVIYDLSRLGRDELVTLLAEHSLKTLNTPIISATEPFPDDDSPYAIMAKGNTRTQNAVYRATVRRNTMEGRYRKAREGKFIGNRPPFGYRHKKKEHGVLEIDESQAKWVRRMFEWVDQGLGYKAIAAKLTKLKAPTPNKDHPARTERSRWGWHFTSVKKIVNNRRYMGEGHYKDIPVPYPPIVSKELFERVQAKLHDRPSPRSTKRTYVLQHLLKCGTCGGRYGARIVHRSGRGEVPLYFCRQRHVYGPQAGHDKIQWSWDGEELEEKVKNLLTDFLADPSKFDARLEELVASPASKNMPVDLTPELRANVDRLKQKIKRMIDGWENGVYENEKEYLERLSTTRQELKEVEKQLSLVKVDPTDDVFTEFLRHVDALIRIKDNGQLTRERWRQELQDLVAEIVVEPNGDLSLVFLGNHCSR